MSHSMASSRAGRSVRRANDVSGSDGPPQPSALAGCDADAAQRRRRRRGDSTSRSGAWDLCMGRVGDPWDNALMESAIGTIKAELVNRHIFQTRDQARLAVFDYIEAFYNPIRAHSALGHLSPDEYEARYHQTHPATGKPGALKRRRARCGDASSSDPVRQLATFLWSRFQIFRGAVRGVRPGVRHGCQRELGGVPGSLDGCGSREAHRPRDGPRIRLPRRRSGGTSTPEWCRRGSVGDRRFAQPRLGRSSIATQPRSRRRGSGPRRARRGCPGGVRQRRQ
jgi:hypothetical protein